MSTRFEIITTDARAVVQNQEEHNGTLRSARERADHIARHNVCVGSTVTVHPYSSDGEIMDESKHSAKGELDESVDEDDDGVTNPVLDDSYDSDIVD